MRLAIADPPYPPLFAERHDLVDGGARVTKRSRSTRWYGEGPRSKTDSPPADFHPDAERWDRLSEHRRLLLNLVAEYDGFALATSPDGLGAYHPLPIAARVMVWHRPTGIPGGHKIISRWEPVILLCPIGRRTRAQERVGDVLTKNAPQEGFVGKKPPEWAHWVLDAMGFDPAVDTVDDLFPGSGGISDVIAERSLR